MTLAEKIRALFTTYKGVFQGAMAAYVGDWTKIATKVQSNSTSNTYGWLGQSATFREWVGSRVTQAISTFGYTVLNKTKEMTVSIKREDVEDDNLGIYDPLVQDMGQEAVRDIDALVYGALKDNGECFDNLSYFHAEHPIEFNSDGTAVEDGATFSNILAPTDPDDAVQAWYVMDTSRVIKPILYQERRAAAFISKTDLASENVFNNNEFVFGADKRDAVGYTLPQFAIKCTVPLTDENFKAARAMLAGMTGDKGKRLGLRATTVVVGTQQQSDAEAVFDRQYLANGASNPLYGKGTEVIVTSYIED